LNGEVDDRRIKVILVGDSDAGKTQIRRRLGGVLRFEEKHNSTDTAEVTSMEVTKMMVSMTQWTESQKTALTRDAMDRALLDRENFAPSAAPILYEGIDDNDNDVENDGAVRDDTENPAQSGPADVSVMSADLTPRTEPRRRDVLRAPRVVDDADIVDTRKILAFWDFAGQAEYFVVHDLFLTRGAVYVLVIDWTKGVEAARKAAQLWLDAIRAHVAGALVLPVLTRCAEQDDGRLRQVVRKVEMLAGCAPVLVDSKTDENYDELKRRLLAKADEQLRRNGKVPLRWLQLHDELCRLCNEDKKQWITRDEFRTLLQSLSRKDDEESALEYLRQSGTVLACGGAGGRVCVTGNRWIELSESKWKPMSR
jgi:GTPase SAR1 family protein